MDADWIMTVWEASDYLRISPSALYACCQRGQLPYIKWGRRLRFRKRDLDRYLEDHQRPVLEAHKADGTRRRP